MDVTNNRIFWGISLVKLKSEIHSPGNFLLVLLKGAFMLKNVATFVQKVALIWIKTAFYFSYSGHKGFKLLSLGETWQWCYMPLGFSQYKGGRPGVPVRNFHDNPKRYLPIFRQPLSDP